MIIRILRMKFLCKSLKAAYDFRCVPWRFCNIRQPASFALHSPALICFPQMLIPQYKTLIFSTAVIDQSERSHVSLVLDSCAGDLRLRFNWRGFSWQPSRTNAAWASDTNQSHIHLPHTGTRRSSENAGVDWQRVLSVTHSSASGVS